MIMKYKYSILAAMSSLVLGFIPINIKKDNITYTIYSSSIVNASKAKEELVEFYKNYCYSSLFINIDSKIKNNLDKLNINATYKDHTFTIYSDESTNIKMMGYLYQSSPSNISFKYYFNSLTYSMPLAISTNVATSIQSDHN